MGAPPPSFPNSLLDKTGESHQADTQELSFRSRIVGGKKSKLSSELLKYLQLPSLPRNGKAVSVPEIMTNLGPLRQETQSLLFSKISFSFYSIYHLITANQVARSKF